AQSSMSTPGHRKTASPIFTPGRITSTRRKLKECWFTFSGPVVSQIQAFSGFGRSLSLLSGSREDLYLTLPRLRILHQQGRLPRLPREASQAHAERPDRFH